MRPKNKKVKIDEESNLPIDLSADNIAPAMPDIIKTPTEDDLEFRNYFERLHILLQQIIAIQESYISLIVRARASKKDISQRFSELLQIINDQDLKKYFYKNPELFPYGFDTSIENYLDIALQFAWDCNFFCIMINTSEENNEDHELFISHFPEMFRQNIDSLIHSATDKNGKPLSTSSNIDFCEDDIEKLEYDEKTLSFFYSPVNPIKAAARLFLDALNTDIEIFNRHYDLMHEWHKVYTELCRENTNLFLAGGKITYADLSQKHPNAVPHDFRESCDRYLKTTAHFCSANKVFRKYIIDDICFKLGDGKQQVIPPIASCPDKARNMPSPIKL